MQIGLLGYISLIPLLDAFGGNIPGIATAPHVIINSKKVIDSWGKVTVLAKDTPGFM